MNTRTAFEKGLNNSAIHEVALGRQSGYDYHWNHSQRRNSFAVRACRMGIFLILISCFIAGDFSVWYNNKKLTPKSTV